MNFRNRIWACALALCLLLTAFPLWGGLPCFAVPAAQAESGREILEISMSAKPAELVEPGDVMLNFSISNNSAVEAQNIYLSSSDGLFSEPMGQVSAGKTESFNRQHSVTQDELDAGEVTYIISHDDPFDPALKVNYTVHCSIGRGDIMPRAEFTRQLSSRQATTGSTLTITYRIRNTGNVALTNLRVQDTLGDYTGRIERLEVGESRSLISRATITEECISSAMLDYNADGTEDKLFTQGLSDIHIGIAQNGLETIFSANHSAFSRNQADAVLILNNTGNVDIREIRVSDDIYGGIIADNLVLPAGSDPLEISYTYPVRGNSGYRWHVSGVTSAGDAIDFRTDTAYLPAAETASPAELSIEATLHTPRIRRAGNVRTTICIRNDGGTDAENVVLSEALQGKLYNFVAVPGNDEIRRDFIFRAEEDSVYHFNIRYTDSNGEEKTVSCAPLELTIAPDGVLPEGAKQQFIEFTGTSIKIGGSSTFAVLLIAGITVLLALIIMLIIASRRARIQKQLRIAVEKQRRREEMGKNNRPTPVRAGKNKSKGRN